MLATHIWIIEKAQEHNRDQHGEKQGWVSQQCRENPEPVSVQGQQFPAGTTREAAVEFADFGAG